MRAPLLALPLVVLAAQAHAQAFPPPADASARAEAVFARSRAAADAQTAYAAEDQRRTETALTALDLARAAPVEPAAEAALLRARSAPDTAAQARARADAAARRLGEIDAWLDAR